MSIAMPNKIYLRRGEAFELLRRAGFTDYACRQLATTPQLKPIQLTPGGRAHFKTSDVAALVVNEPKQEKAKTA